MGLKIAFCSNQCNPYYNEVIRGITETVDRTGDTELISLKGMHRFPVQALRVLKPDAIIAGPVTQENVDLHFPDVPVIGISNALKEKPFPSVLNDDREAGRQAARAAAQAGYDHIAVVSGLDFHFTALREQGITEACEDWNLSFKRYHLKVRKTGEREKYQDVWNEYEQSLKDMLLSLPDNTAILPLEPRLAEEIMAAQPEEIRSNIPDKTGLILVDLPLSDSQGVSYVRLRAHAIGVTAMDLLMQKYRQPSLQLAKETLVVPDGVSAGDTLRTAPGVFTA